MKTDLAAAYMMFGGLAGAIETLDLDGIAADCRAKLGDADLPASKRDDYEDMLGAVLEMRDLKEGDAFARYVKRVRRSLSSMKGMH